MLQVCMYSCRVSLSWSEFRCIINYHPITSPIITHFPLLLFSPFLSFRFSQIDRSIQLQEEEIAYNTMGNDPGYEILKGLDLTKTPVYLVGTVPETKSSRARYFNISQSSLDKLDTQPTTKILQFQVSDHTKLPQIHSMSFGTVLVRRYKSNQVVLGVIRMGESFRGRVSQIKIMLRRQLKLDQKQSVFFYHRGRQCLHDEVLKMEPCYPPFNSSIVVLDYSSMQVSG